MASKNVLIDNRANMFKELMGQLKSNQNDDNSDWLGNEIDEDIICEELEEFQVKNHNHSSDSQYNTDQEISIEYHSEHEEDADKQITDQKEI